VKESQNPITGLEMFDALKKATDDLVAGEPYHLNRDEVRHFFPLTDKDLVARGYGPNRAEEINNALCQRNYQPLFDSLGVRIVLTDDAPRLFPHRD
jgi:hypothetical protein